jgi:hypothetical protein
VPWSPPALPPVVQEHFGEVWWGWQPGAPPVPPL